jgi:O-antigen ligase
MMTFLCAFALLHIALYVFLLLYPQMQGSVSDLFQYALDVGSGDDARFVFFTPSLDNGVYRIYFGSSFLLLIGLYFSVTRPTNVRIGWLRLEYVMALLILGALWATNTRSLMLGAATFIALYPFCLLFVKKVEQSYWSIFLLLALPIVCSFLLVPTVDPTTLQLIGLGRNVSDDVRSVQFASLFDAFKNSPLFGLGFGSNATFIRAQDTPYAYELSIVGLLMKVGTVGLLAACAIWAGVLDTFRSPGNTRAAREVAALYALYCSFVISCFYNPYIFGFFGTFFLLFVLYEFSYVMRGAEND